MESILSYEMLLVIYLSVSPSLSLSLSLCLSVSVCLSFSRCLSLYLSLSNFVCLSLAVCQSVCLSVSHFRSVNLIINFFLATFSILIFLHPIKSWFISVYWSWSLMPSIVICHLCCCCLLITPNSVWGGGVKYFCRATIISLFLTLAMDCGRFTNIIPFLIMPIYVQPSRW